MKKRKILNGIILLSFMVLSIAYFIEFILGHQPCNLCKYERIPYLSAIILISLSFLIKKFEKSILIFIAILFLLGTIVSFYHFGIEQGFFSENLICGLEGSQKVTNSEELLKELKKTRISCKDVTFRLFGLSLATINTVLSLVITATLFKTIINYEKN
tara:strand:+ start:628 stop:1101 length:474 start_codon:yes stop_codon:yes gene_type:complete